MDFQGRLDLVKTTVDEKLRLFFSQKRQEAKRISSHCMELTDQVADLTMRGGKRTRAFLVWLGHEAAISDKRKVISKTQPLIRAMMAVELFQSFALIHDDIIDEDTLRRGGSTVHEYFKSKVISHKSKVQYAKHFGVSMAILAGDLALVWADELMKKGKRQTENGKREDIYQKMKEEVVLGQSLDVLASVGMPSADRATINRYKTAWYSVIRPLQIGAAIAWADEKMLETFVHYGLAVGETYQLRDDVLDGAIPEDIFANQAARFQDQATQAIKKLNVSRSAAGMLGDFARFAQDRRA